MHFPPGARTAIKPKKAKRSQEEGSRNNNGDLINAGCLERPAIVTNFGASDQEEQKKVPRSNNRYEKLQTPLKNNRRM